MLFEFEDVEFKEDNKALNDQGEGEGTNSFLSSLNSSSSNSSGSVLTLLTSQNNSLDFYRHVYTVDVTFVTE